MSATVTIVPASCQSAAQTAYYRALIRSHKSSCDSDLLFIFNNLHEKPHRDLAEKFTKELSDLKLSEKLNQIINIENVKQVMKIIYKI